LDAVLSPPQSSDSEARKLLRRTPTLTSQSRELWQLIVSRAALFPRRLGFQGSFEFEIPNTNLKTNLPHPRQELQIRRTSRQL